MNSKQRRKATREFDKQYPYSYAYRKYPGGVPNWEVFVLRQKELGDWFETHNINYRYKDGRIYFNKEKDYIFYMLKFV